MTQGGVSIDLRLTVEQTIVLPSQDVKQDVQGLQSVTYTLTTASSHIRRREGLQKLLLIQLCDVDVV